MLGAIGPAIGDTRIPGGLLERGLLLRIRFGLDLYINYRPFRATPGSLADGCEFAIVRENTEGPYAGEGGVLRYGTDHEIATQGSVNTRFGVERCVRFAFEKALTLDSPKVTLVHKTNVLTFAGNLWTRVMALVGAEYPQVAVDYQHVDAIVSAVLMLEHLGETEAASRIRAAVADFDGDPVALGTTGITNDILRRI